MALPYRRGDSLIGVIIALGIFVILSQAVITLAFSAYDLISYARARISARHIALESMEIIRNAPYDDVGTVGGIPTGIFIQDQSIQRNGQNYTIRTRVNYIDDPFDGEFPADTLPVDYKRVKVDVSWGGLASANFSEVSLVTDIAPRGTESAAGTGTLSILVFDALGQPVAQAQVQITATTVPPVNATYFTSDTGRVTLPGSPICNTCYQITVTKAGYSTDRTYSTTEVTNPTKPLITVLAAQLTEASFNIDRFARLDVTTLGEEPELAVLPNQIVRIRGQKTIGTDGLDDPVYKFDQEIVTDSAGKLVIEELEWDNYEISLPTDSTVEIAGINPISPISIDPAEDIALLISLATDDQGSLLTRFEDGTSGLVASVAATLKDGVGYEASESSGVTGAANFGQVFFDGLEDKAYTLIATASGFLEFTIDIPVSGDQNERLILTPE
ncbi:hypothetical protein A2803_04430 [Candidatus Woesebacteria bacterium RIFCSPHIGHO2_01_FULL_44_21]|uniref:Carboxypeptidase regulatory-like domain-containing protein n=1 Tax=Candidatus Woesebacteria bacterium RIFCSPHIGHO2_01_FULL_44_21 TaxID=1802503 RepID=A0A1F7YWJ9_9BACT|nr:MAG: hypothetical protein A2803_04430 [Candidatus Woesebacteria bacterium RIFCSPHIGHO2_01_FULL_44_21]OGM71319.1 MAG: hypothetical protein A2897_00795 [Candidatus Woesebacteria bacterium RIFCSPLOWO2_01_FULL_44_24b]